MGVLEALHICIVEKPRRFSGWNDDCLDAKGGCSDGMAVVLRQGEAAVMEWRSF